MAKTTETKLIPIDKIQLEKVSELCATLRSDLKGYSVEKQIFYMIQLGISASRTLITVPRELAKWNSN